MAHWERYQPKLKLETVLELSSPDEVTDIEADAGSIYDDHNDIIYRSSCEISTSPVVVQPLTAASSPSEATGSASTSKQYVTNLLHIADRQTQRRKRVRFEDCGASPGKRSLIAERLEDIIYGDDRETASDGDIIRLQMLALAELQEQKKELGEMVARLQDERSRLLDLNQQQTAKRLEILNQVVRRRGQELKSHGEYLIDLAEKEAACL